MTQSKMQARAKRCPRCKGRLQRNKYGYSHVYDLVQIATAKTICDYSEEVTQQLHAVTAKTKEGA